MNLGHYEYDPGQSALGGGAMGNVHRALDTRTGTPVALKVLHPHLSEDDESILRLRREARLASRIHHPNIARPLDQGQDGDVYWVAMELVDGRSLKRRLREDGRVTEAEAVAVGVAMARALQAAHQAGVVHRDVKPGNILLSKGREFDVAGIKLGDFGASRGSDLTRITRGPAFVGTPEYTAPEAFDLKTSELSDIYSLGVTLYEIVTGRLPFSGDFGTLERAHRGRSPDMLPVRHAAPLLATVIETMLAKSARGRYQTAEAVLTALEAIKHPLDELVLSLPFGRLDDQTTIARTVGSTVRTAWRAPVRWKLASAGLLLVAAVSGVAAVDVWRGGDDGPGGGGGSGSEVVNEGSPTPFGEVLGTQTDAAPTPPGSVTSQDFTVVGPARPTATPHGDTTEPTRTSTPIPATTPPPPPPPPPPTFVVPPTQGFVPPTNVPATPTIAPTDTPTSTPSPTVRTTALQSNESWFVNGVNAGLVCLRADRPSPCPSGALLFNYNGDAWRSSLSSTDPGYPFSASKPKWIWAPNIDGASTGANGASYCFNGSVPTPGTITGGNVWYVADDFITIKVNGTMIINRDRRGYNTNDPLKKKTIPFAAMSGRPVQELEVCVENANISSCTDGGYYCNPAGFALQAAFYHTDP